MEIRVSVRQGLFNAQILVGGRGEPLLFLHGAGGLRGWTPFLELLSQHFSVYAPYHPGHGDSDGLEHLDDMLDFTLYSFDLLDELHLETVYVVGHSMGGMLAAEMAALCSHRIRKLVLAAPAGLWLDEAPVLDFFALTPEELMPFVWHDPTSAVAQQYSLVPGKDEAVLIERAKSLAAAGKFLWPIPDRGLKKRLHRIQAPTLLLWGESDALIPPAYGPQFLRGIRGSRLQIMKECGHNLMLEKPEEFASLVTSFLTEAPPAGRQDRHQSLS